MSDGQSDAREREIKHRGVITIPVPPPVEEVAHPAHYNQGKIETIDFIEDRDHLGFNRQNAIKYIDRSGMKASESKETSLRKAIWYLERELGMHKKGEL